MGVPPPPEGIMFLQIPCFWYTKKSAKTGIGEDIQEVTICEHEWEEIQKFGK